MADVPLKDRRTISEAMSLKAILRLLPESRQNYFPVVNDDGRLVGMFSTDDLRSYLYDDAIWQLAVARDIMTTKLVTLAPDDDLNTAMRRFTDLNLDELPVLNRDDSGHLIGMLRRRDVIAAYNSKLTEHKLKTTEYA